MSVTSNRRFHPLTPLHEPLLGLPSTALGPEQGLSLAQNLSGKQFSCYLLRMARPKKDDQDRLRHTVPVLFNDHDLQIITRMTRAHGISRGEAVRRLFRAGAELTEQNS